MTAFGVIRVLEPDGLPGIDENSVGLIDPDSARITKQIPVGRGPTAIRTAAARCGSPTRATGRSRGSTASATSAVTIPVGGAPAALAFAGGSLWVADSDGAGGGAGRPGREQGRAADPVGNAPRALAVTAGALWVASGVDGRIRRIDLDRGRAAPSIPVGANPSAIAAGAGALWVASEEAGTVTRVEPRSGSVLPPIRVGNGPSALAVGEGAVWVVNRHDGTLSRIDPATNKVSWTGSVGSDPTAVAAGEGSVWVAGGEEGVRRSTRAGRDAVEQDRRPAAARRRSRSPAARCGRPRTRRWPRIAAARCARSCRTKRGRGPDGLAALRRRTPPGRSSARWPTTAWSPTVVSRAPPAPRSSARSPRTCRRRATAGRTYVFTLRRGLRFSDGTPVRPVDVRGLDRTGRAGHAGPPPGEQLPTFFAGIVGARRCVAGRRRCDLARGIETDAPARTVTIHLTRPDADFLHKLATTFGYVVPAGSARRTSTGRTPPGTGPYRVAAWDARRGGTLVRNRYFRPTPARPLGAGFADRIDVRLHDVGRPSGRSPPSSAAPPT